MSKFGDSLENFDFLGFYRELARRKAHPEEKLPPLEIPPDVAEFAKAMYTALTLNKKWQFELISYCNSMGVFLTPDEANEVLKEADIRSEDEFHKKLPDILVKCAERKKADII